MLCSRSPFPSPADALMTLSAGEKKKKTRECAITLGKIPVL